MLNYSDKFSNHSILSLTCFCFSLTCFKTLICCSRLIATCSLWTTVAYSLAFNSSVLLVSLSSSKASLTPSLSSFWNGKLCFSYIYCAYKEQKTHILLGLQSNLDYLLEFVFIIPNHLHKHHHNICIQKFTFTKKMDIWDRLMTESFKICWNPNLSPECDYGSAVQNFTHIIQDCPKTRFGGTLLVYTI